MELKQKVFSKMFGEGTIANIKENDFIQVNFVDLETSEILEVEYDYESKKSDDYNDVLKGQYTNKEKVTFYLIENINSYKSHNRLFFSELIEDLIEQQNDEIQGDINKRKINIDLNKKIFKEILREYKVSLVNEFIDLSINMEMVDVKISFLDRNDNKLKKELNKQKKEILKSLKDCI